MLTQREYYLQMEREHPGTMILMKYYTEYDILGERAREAVRIVEPLLTHKDAGKCFCFDTENWGYDYLSFGVHNIDRVLKALIREGIRCLLVDFNKAFRESGGWEEIDRINAKYEADREDQERRHQKPVQLSLFDAWGI